MILVKENGLRFYTETAGQRAHEYFAAALAWTGDPKKMNGGGPIWAIFDAEAVAREKWDVKPPHVDPDGYFFSADTIEELAAQIVNEYQWRPMPPAALRQTVERYNSFVDKGVDADFKKPRPLHKIVTPPFYAAWHTPALHDSYTGIRINTLGQVIDLRGQADPGPLCVRRFGRRVSASTGFAVHRRSAGSPAGTRRASRGKHHCSVLMFASLMIFSYFAISVSMYLAN